MKKSELKKIINEVIVEQTDETSMITIKDWTEFRNTGLVLFINQILHVFGWAIVFDMDGDIVKSVYPARVKFRGFGEESTSKAYQKISKYMEENASELSKEANS